MSFLPAELRHLIRSYLPNPFREAINIFLFKLNSDYDQQGSEAISWVDEFNAIIEDIGHVFLGPNGEYQYESHTNNLNIDTLQMLVDRLITDDFIEEGLNDKYYYTDASHLNSFFLRNGIKIRISINLEEEDFAPMPGSIPQTRNYRFDVVGVN